MVMAPVDHSFYSKRSSRRKQGEIDKLLERMHIRLALAAFKAQYGYETCALDTLESKLMRHSPLSPYNHAHGYAKQVARSTTSSNESSSSTERKVRSSSRLPIRKAYHDYVVHSTRTPPPTSPHRRSIKAASKAYLTPTSPMFNPPVADESAKRSTTPHRSRTPRSMSPTYRRQHHSPTPQKPSTSLWDQAAEPSVDETNAANLLMGLWYAR
ncbi:hypothetical protein K450DRAFT_263518 [Umbelopsis ramanniana AG]|uniref:Uncharacterized protein n=1 Tax=Umbelopsis ramanniana AG TaxID=1314678 RepID=A0AAD5E183_UMBRA|nr:uncharacterized protein K450DRAFT_263518 [Umbelopsis ramanniana AG]KAI8575059.1 hypothetical protein K450DRAFT_263518 [Umbelopsis ramanniana AG]